MNCFQATTSETMISNSVGSRNRTVTSCLDAWVFMSAIFVGITQSWSYKRQFLIATWAITLLITFTTGCQVHPPSIYYAITSSILHGLGAHLASFWMISGMSGDCNNEENILVFKSLNNLCTRMRYMNKICWSNHFKTNIRSLHYHASLSRWVKTNTTPING